MLTLIIVSIFACVALLTGAALYPLLSRKDIVKERMAKMMPRKMVQPKLVSAPTKWQHYISEMGGKLRVKPADMRIFKEMVTASGFKSDSVYLFLGSKLLLTTAFPAVYLTLFVLPHGTVDNNSLLVAAACAISGYLLPTILLSRLAEKRKTDIFHSLPDVLDLLTVCVEAGLSLDSALIKTAENFQQRDNPLIKEINRVTQEIRVGKPRTEALKSLAERTMVDDIKSFVAMLIQTEKFGTSLGKTLRTFSDSLRTKRKQLAEEQAAKTGIKMLFPLTFCVFPSLLVVILVPAIFKIFGMFSKF